MLAYYKSFKETFEIKKDHVTKNFYVIVLQFSHQFWNVKKRSRFDGERNEGMKSLCKMISYYTADTFSRNLSNYHMNLNFYWVIRYLNENAFQIGINMHFLIIIQIWTLSYW